MIWQTPVHIPSPAFSISHRQRLAMFGSCFADAVSERLKVAGFDVCNNPFGVLYNPLSISTAIRRITEGTPFTADELTYHNGLYHSMMHHGSFSSPDAELCLQQINNQLLAAHEAVKEADVLLLTFGTAWIYEQQGRVVSNCHKMPADIFTRRRLSVEEIVTDWTELLSHPALANKQLIFTVSPVRHLKDGLHENQLSKATLLLAIDQLVQSHPLRNYFPSYEIVMDQLRDYRFYAEDMCHPSRQAVDYVYERFTETYFSEETKQIATECEKLWLLKQHRPLHPNSEAFQKHLLHIQQKEAELQQRYPFLHL
ncbi:MAG: GSCFA domain-containing protein [Paludibacteraceae bacterium]|nr:GSCFA domain-containing protein [Paludibacteraceae bacterium]